MNETIAPGPRSGTVRIPASKSQAHRLLILAALGKNGTELVCDGFSRDILATVDCLRALGARIRETAPGRLAVEPVHTIPESLCHLRCGESGSTLRFLLPVAAALGARAVFHMEGRLPERPLAPLDAALQAHGVSLTRQGNTLLVQGKLRAGDYRLPGNVSSQYISGLLMALPLLEADSTLEVTGPLESAAYITMTEDALRQAQAMPEKNGRLYHITGSCGFSLPQTLSVEGDYSNAAFFLCMGALSERGVTVTGLNSASHQGDRAVVEILRAFGAQVRTGGDWVQVRRGELRAQEISAQAIPDLIPVLSVVAAAAEGKTRIVNAARLRLKESDRLHSTAQLLTALGAAVTELEDGLVIHGGALRGGTADAFGDHRIAMSAAVAACACRETVTISGSESVNKSYPAFWRDFMSLEVGMP